LLLFCRSVDPWSAVVSVSPLRMFATTPLRPPFQIYELPFLEDILSAGSVEPWISFFRQLTHALFGRPPPPFLLLVLPISFFSLVSLSYMGKIGLLQSFLSPPSFLGRVTVPVCLLPPSSLLSAALSLSSFSADDVNAL